MKRLESKLFGWNRSTKSSRANTTKGRRHSSFLNRKSRLEALERRDLLAADIGANLIAASAVEHELIGPMQLKVASEPMSISAIFDRLHSDNTNSPVATEPPILHSLVRPLSFEFESEQSELEPEQNLLSGGSGGSGGSTVPAVGLSGGSTMAEPLPSHSDLSYLNVTQMEVSGGSNGPVTINIQISGSASADDVRLVWNNQEVVVTGNQFSILTAGPGTQDLHIYALADGLIEGTETLVFSIVDSSAYTKFQNDAPLFEIFDGSYSATFEDTTLKDQPGTAVPVPFDCGCTSSIQLTQAGDIVLSFVAEVSAPAWISDSLTVSGTIGEESFTQTKSFLSLSSSVPERLSFSFTFPRSLFGEEEYASYEVSLTSTLLGAEPAYQLVDAPRAASGQVYFGTPGVNVSGVPRLGVDDSGAMYSDSLTGSYFPQGVGSTFLSARGMFANLTATLSGYELVDRDHNTYLFDEDGYATSFTDALGRVTTYSYVSHTTGRQISSIVSPFVSTNFSYSSEKLTSVSDSRGNYVSLAYASGRLISATQNDPDGIGPLPSPVTSYNYNVGGRVASILGPGGLLTSYGYDTSGYFASVTEPSGITTSMVSPQSNAKANGTPTLVTTRQGIIFRETYDQLGNVVEIADGLGNKTIHERDWNGLVTKTTLSDPDGAGPKTSSVFEYTFDARGNLLSETLPDESTRVWEYHSTWNYPILTTDTNGSSTQYEYDLAMPLILSQTKIVGDPDDLLLFSRSVNDDLTTVFTYTPSPVLPGDPPQGLVSSITEPDGAITEYEYSSLGQVTRTTYAVGTPAEASTSATYCGCGGVSSTTDELGNTTTYQRDGLNRVTTITMPDPDGLGPLSSTVVQYTYNAMGLIATETINGRVTTYGYDSSGRKTSVTLPDPDGVGPLLAPVTSYTYDSLGNVTSTTDPLGNTTVYGYTNGLLTSVTLPDPDGLGPLAAPVTSFAYDLAGNVTSLTDPFGKATLFTYDGLGRQTSITLPDPDGVGPQTSPVYTVVYDELGRVVGESDFAGTITTYAFDSEGNLISKTTPVGTTNYFYDELNQLVEIKAPDPNGGPLDVLTTTFSYFSSGLLAATTTSLGTTSYEYNGTRQLTKATSPDPDGAGPLLAPWTVFARDLAGKVLTETNRLGHVTQYEYDNLGKVVLITDSLDGETAINYDQFGNRTSLTDPVGNTTTWNYDMLNRVVSESNQLNDARHYKYDSASNLTEYEDRNGRVTKFTYDGLQRRVGESWWDGVTPIHTIAYQYDQSSRMISASDIHASYQFAYDFIGRNTQIVHELDSLGFDVVIDQSFDGLSRRTSLSATIDGVADLKNEYLYNHLSQITRVTQAGQVGGNAVAEKRADFSYDSNFASQFGTIKRYADLAGTKMAAITEYEYDPVGRVSEIAHLDNGAVQLAAYQYAYNAASQLTQFLVAGYSNENAVYTYDDVGQLTGADRSGTTHDEAYTYDENGNRIGGGYVVGGDNRLLSDGTFDYTYDAEGNRLSKTNKLTDEAIAYTWDYRNRLTSIVTKNSLDIVTHSVEYVYDVFDRRIVKEIDSDGAGVNAPVQESYVYDGLRSERGNAGDHILLRFDDTGDLTSRYFYGPAVDQILAEEDIASPSIAGDVLWALTDHLGSVRDLLEYDTANDESTVVNHIVYDAFGRIVDESAPGFKTLFGFTGRERDAESDLQYNRARYYDAATGRWVNQDPIGFGGGDANLYRYVGHDAANSVDPSGLLTLSGTSKKKSDSPHQGQPKDKNATVNSILESIREAIRNAAENERARKAKPKDTNRYWAVVLIRQPAPGTPTCNVGSDGGHAAVGIVDISTELVTLVGKHPKFGGIGTVNLINGEGEVVGNLDPQNIWWDVGRAYPLTESEYDKLSQEIATALNSSHVYDMNKSNCLDFAYSTLERVSIKITIVKAEVNHNNLYPKEKPISSPGATGHDMGNNGPPRSIPLFPVKPVR